MKYEKTLNTTGVLTVQCTQCQRTIDSLSTVLTYLDNLSLRAIHMTLVFKDDAGVLDGVNVSEWIGVYSKTTPECLPERYRRKIGCTLYSFVSPRARVHAYLTSLVAILVQYSRTVSVYQGVQRIISPLLGGGGGLGSKSPDLCDRFRYRKFFTFANHE